MYTDEDRQSALTRALIMAGGAMTQPGPGGFAAALGRGGMMGASTYNDAFNDIAQRKMREEAIRRSALETKLQEISIARQQALQGIFQDFAAGGGASRPAGMGGPAMADAPDWKDNPMNAGSAAAAPSVRSQAAQSSSREEDLIKRLAAGGYSAEAKAQLEIFKGLEGEVYGEPQVDANGRVYVMTKRGPKYVEGGQFKPRDELVQMDLGGQTGLRGKYDTNLRATFNKTPSADTIFNAANPAAVKVEGATGSYWDFPPGRGQGVGAPRQGTGAAPSQAGPPAGFVSKAQAEREDAIRKEFRANQTVKDYETIMPILAAARAAGDTRLGDVNLVYAAAKMFDPGSVVREGEYGTVVSANNIPNWVAGHINALAGGGRLSAGARKELMAELDARAGAYEKNYQTLRGTYEKTVKDFGLDPSRIFTDYASVLQNRKGGKIGAGSASGTARVIDFNDLPK